ncbi:excisionase family DNA binding protein [Kribbella amoyensis]|uniref:Excisionase family DNA binding protein n=1 Tax=Kribbella amoyensis TaxID=996641 RepID=A0A561BRY5_9ACTN|nr:excisionase family DNA binding protein [Kribbella amoyensis]
MTDKAAGAGDHSATLGEGPGGPSRLRQRGRELALESALRKRAAGVPSYTIPEAAALCSVSQEHLYRLVRDNAFPAIRMQRGDGKGRYVIPARAVEQLLQDAASGSGCVEASDWSSTWNSTLRQSAGGAA